MGDESRAPAAPTQSQLAAGVRRVDVVQTPAPDSIGPHPRTTSARIAAQNEQLRKTNEKADATRHGLSYDNALPGCPRRAWCSMYRESLGIQSIPGFRGFRAPGPRWPCPCPKRHDCSRC
jgi:hypothetical protein